MARLLPGKRLSSSLMTRSTDRQQGLAMKKLLLATAALFALAGGSAVAADMPVKAYAPPPVVYSWTGCYVGVGGGYGMWNQDTYIETFPGLVGRTAVATTGGRGWFGTAQVGCDYQITGSWVIGAFGDWDVGSIKGQFGGATEVEGIGQEKLTSSWAAGGRVGYVVFPKLLVFVSGGYTQAHFNQINLGSDTGVGPGPGFYAPSQTYTGWFLGSGYDYAIDYLPGLFWKTEYRYASYSARDIPFLSNTTNLPTGFGMNSSKEIQTVRTELVWRFNWGGPVVAKY
jgi:outer membrane immunogenic protein